MKYADEILTVLCLLRFQLLNYVMHRFIIQVKILLFELKSGFNIEYENMILTQKLYKIHGSNQMVYNLC